MKISNLFLGSLILAAALQADPTRADRTDLVLLVVIDQLRGAAPESLRERFGTDGFRYLMDNGVVFGNAQFSHANTVTSAGHATLVTGGNAPQHGMAANDWYDHELRRPMYCTEDDQSPMLHASAAAGRSPRKLTSSTFGDELVLDSGGRSRVFSISLKDRAAIIMGGRLGKAYWYDTSTGTFTTSRYYHDELPAWLEAWNASRPADRYRDAVWRLLHPRETYRHDRDGEKRHVRPRGGHGAAFPHPLGHSDPAVFYSSLRYSPMGDRLTLDAVAALLDAEQPGNSGGTDVLAVSFSATDYVGHAYGPYSLEAEDNLLRLDATLGKLLGIVDRAVGLERTLVVLASDHGVAPSPELMASRGFDAGRLNPEQFLPRLNSALTDRFGVDEQLLLAFLKPGLYLDRDAMARLDLEPAAVERALADAVTELPGVAGALTRSDILSGNVPETAAAARIRAAFHPQRSGDVYVLSDAHWYLSDDPDKNATTHGTPYSYDTHVPLMLAGPGIEPRRVDRPIAPRDLAPTLSAWLRVPLPSGSVGDVLPEVLANRDD